VPPRVVSRAGSACMPGSGSVQGREDGPAKVGQIDLRWISHAANGHPDPDRFDRERSRPDLMPWRHTWLDPAALQQP
jgi:hypothetical protein